MSEGRDPIQEAMTALRLRGHTVEHDGSFENWRIDGGGWITLLELLALARQIGLRNAPQRLQ